MKQQNITEERAARRFHQMRHVEQEIQQIQVAIASCRDHLKELTTDLEGKYKTLRAAARDEGSLPLFDLDSD